MNKKWLFLLPVLIGTLFASKIYHYARSHWIIPDVTVAGFIKMADGLGRQSVELMDNLKDDYDVHFRKTRSTYDLQSVPMHLDRILNERKRPLGKVVIFEDALSQPVECFEKLFTPLKDKQIRLAFSMFETSRIPLSFVNKIHRYFDAVIVADPYNVTSYQDSGVKTPVFHLPLAINLDLFAKTPPKTKANTPFVFGCFSICEHRKNYIGTIQAFAQAFGVRDDVLLRINARRGSAAEITAVREEIKKLNLSNVIFTVESVDQHEYLKNFESIDCYVSLTKGEGFSIPPREALSLGIPVIASDNTAQKTLCQSGFVRSVPSLIEEPAIFEGLPDDQYGSYFNVSINDAATAFQDVFEHYSDYLTLASKGREWVKQYEYKQLKSLYLNLVKPKKIILGDKNILTEDVLITDSQALYNKYRQLYPHLKQ
jgi:glycosyltransferase involved in cell wall biosynthesis